MKNYKFAILILFFITMACSDNDNNQPDGISPDIIKLSKKEVLFNKEENTDTVTTEFPDWTISAVTAILSDKTTNYEFNNNELVGEWFKIKRVSPKTLIISADENRSSKDRTILVHMTSGNYFDNIKIIQSAR